MKNSITYISFKIISKFFCIIPRKLSIFFAKNLGLLIYFILPQRKKVAKINLSIAFPNKTSIEINNIIKKNYQHYMILFIDFLRQKKININDIYLDVNTKKILSNKQGLIFMTAHIGNWEMLLPILSKHKKTTAIVKTQRNLGGDKFVSELRTFNNITLLPMNSSKRKMIQALIDGEILALASDQNAGNKGARALFFGKETSVPKGAAYFYHKTKCPIAIGFCILNKDYTYKFKLEKINIKRNPENIDNLFIEVNTIFTKLLENQIKKCPEQYFWFHRKWDRNIYK